MAARAKAVLALALVALASKNNGAAAEEEHPLAKLFAAMPEGAQVHIHHYVPPNAGDEMPDEGVKGEVAGLKPDETPENAQNELALQIADPMVGGGVAEGRRRSLLLAKAGRGSKGRRRSLLMDADETSEGGTYMDAAADAAENAMGAMKDAAEDTMDAVAEMVGAALAPGPEAELAGTRSSITLDPATLSRPELRYGNYLPQIVARQG